MSLTAKEKEHVAVLLGLKWHHGACILCEEKNPITLEACMEYAKGKGWDVYGIEWQADYERHEAYVCPNRNGNTYHAEDPGPTVAFVRALLKAEEASK